MSNNLTKKRTPQAAKDYIDGAHLLAEAAELSDGWEDLRFNGKNRGTAA